MCYYTYIAVYHVSSIVRRHNNNNLVRTGMKNSSKPWLLGGILLLPGALIALTMQFLSPELLSSDQHQSIRVLSALPPSAAGEADLTDIGGDIWSRALKPVTYTERIRTDEMTGSLTLQVLKYRFRRNQQIAARMQFAPESGEPPRGSHMSLAVTTRQGNYIAEATPEWITTGNGTVGSAMITPEAGWPDQLTLVLTLKAPERLPIESTVDIELFNPKVLIKGVGNISSEGDEWLIPIMAEVFEPGVVVVSARLLDKTGNLVTHIHSRGHFDESGTLEVRLRKKLIEASMLDEGLVMTDISVRHIADSLNADMGWGDSAQGSYRIDPVSAQ